MHRSPTVDIDRTPPIHIRTRHPRIAAQVLHAVMDGATCGRHLPDAGPHRDAVPDPSPCAQIPGRHRPLVGRRRAAAGATCGDGRCDPWSAPTGRRSTSGRGTPDRGPCAQIPGRHWPLVGRRRAAAGAACGDGPCPPAVGTCWTSRGRSTLALAPKKNGARGAVSSSHRSARFTPRCAFPAVRCRSAPGGGTRQPRRSVPGPGSPADALRRWLLRRARRSAGWRRPSGRRSG